MKRLLSALAVMLLLLTMLPFSAVAVETETSERELLISLACKVFPEHATKICSDIHSTTYGLNQRTNRKELVVTETRSISENEQITYSEYSDGSVYLVGASIDPWYLVDSGVSDSSSTTVYTGRFIITSNVNENALVVINNIKYAIVNGAPNYIISKGSATYEDSAELCSAVITRTTQNGNLPAEIKYDVHFISEDGTEVEPFKLYFRLYADRYDTMWSYG